MQAEAFPDGERQQTLAQLSPSRDDDGLLRVNGRLRYANDLPYNVKRPILLLCILNIVWIFNKVYKTTYMWVTHLYSKSTLCTNPA